jgi:hypothetical protein
MLSWLRQETGYVDRDVVAITRTDELWPETPGSCHSPANGQEDLLLGQVEKQILLLATLSTAGSS